MEKMVDVMDGLAVALGRELNEYNRCNDLEERQVRLALVQGLAGALSGLIDSTSTAALGFEDGYYGDDDEDDLF